MHICNMKLVKVMFVCLKIIKVFNFFQTEKEIRTATIPGLPLDKIMVAVPFLIYYPFIRILM
jgi:hypothetical protein